MFPLFSDGSLAKISLCSFEDLNIGDVAVFKSSEGFICHRVFKKTELNGVQFIRTRADVAYESDSPTANNGILGKVTSLKIGPFLVRIDNLMSRMIGLMIASFLPIILQLFFSFKSLVNKWIIK